MKLIKKLIAAALLIIMALSLLVSCKDPAETPAGPVEPEAPLNETDISAYRIIYPDAATSDFTNYVKLFKSELARYTKADLIMSKDELAEAEGAKEILLGETNRSESVTCTNLLSSSRDNAFTIRMTDNKIIIAAKNDEALIRAMKYFLVTYAEPAQNDNHVAITMGAVDNGTVDLNSIIFDNYTEMSTKVSSAVSISGRDFSGHCGYETLIELGHNGENNGTLFASFATYSQQGYMIYKSTDGGKKWEYVSKAVDKYNGSLTDINNPTKHIAKGYCLQPCLFELPADMGDFKEGTLFLGACTTGEGYYNKTLTQTTSMTLYYSTDLGESWTAYCNVDLAGNDLGDNGVWEPYFVFEEETGRVYCFYSDESNEANDKNGDAAQKLVYKYSTDMKTWVGQDGKTGVTDEPIIVANCDQYNVRPGMISIAKMGNGEYFMTYEICNLNGCPIYYRKSTSISDWPNKGDLGTEIVSVDGKKLGSAPWCAWTPSGGECGTLFVIGDRKTLFLSFDYGETFISITNPMYEGQSGAEKESYSPFLGFGSDPTLLYYVDNPIDPTYGYQKVYFKSIKIW